jgi:ADP-heptose:LPS heptosyltransferase
VTRDSSNFVNSRSRSFDNIFALGKKLETLPDTAAICKLVDLVITADTGVAHLSATLVKPTSVLLAYRTDWCWSSEGKTTRWYPCVRLICQTRCGGWKRALNTWHIDCLQDLT